jgi:predicted phosphodiesterase
MTDTLRPETVDECARILIESKVDGVMGNHEYSFVTHHFKRYPEKFSESARRYVGALPYTLVIADVCFAHFCPDESVYGLYTATDEEGYKAALLKSKWPVLINGHSHDPRIYCSSNGSTESAEFTPGTPSALSRETRYVLTCGSLEDSWCAIYDSTRHEFEVIRLDP